MGRKFNNIGNKKYGNITVTEENFRVGKHLFWVCVCECGEKFNVTSSDLERGRRNYCPKCNDIKSDESPIKTLYRNYKKSAENRNYSFELSIDEFKEIISKKCNYCGSEPSQILHKKRMKSTLIYNGIDRVENNIGYIYSNCVPACKFCNFAKKNYPIEEFLEWIERIKRNTLRE